MPKQVQHDNNKARIPAFAGMTYCYLLSSHATTPVGNDILLKQFPIAQTMPTIVKQLDDTVT
ncbi:hypothetical protein [Rickettsia endosymbiont of Orchestes rusci]|uniref:hypothetical protein n=1 Tax=Rickettsia endosymbiont of Orchestes rusci TaxID=3066250 RepID=UPI00313AF2D5